MLRPIFPNAQGGQHSNVITGRSASSTTTECCCYYYSSIVSCEVRQQDAQQAVGAPRSAALEEQPGGLQIIKCGDAVQEPVLLRAFPLELARDDIHDQGGNPARSDPNWITAPSGEVSDVRRLFASGIPNTPRAKELAYSSRAVIHLILLERIDFPCRQYGVCEV